MTGDSLDDCDPAVGEGSAEAVEVGLGSAEAVAVGEGSALAVAVGEGSALGVAVVVGSGVGFSSRYRMPPFPPSSSSTFAASMFLTAASGRIVTTLSPLGVLTISSFVSVFTRSGKWVWVSSLFLITTAALPLALTVVSPPSPSSPSLSLNSISISSTSCSVSISSSPSSSSVKEVTFNLFPAGSIKMLWPFFLPFCEFSDEGLSPLLGLALFDWA